MMTRIFKTVAFSVAGLLCVVMIAGMLDLIGPAGPVSAQDKKISELADGSPGQATDAIPIARGGVNYRLPFSAFGTAFVHGSFYGDEVGWTLSSAVQDTWFAINDVDIDDGQLSLITHNGSGRLTVTEPGKYLATYTLTLEMGGANNHCKVGFMVNGSAVTPGRHHTQHVTANAEISVAGTAILDLADNAYVEVGIMNPDPGVPSALVDHINLTLVRMQP